MLGKILLSQLDKLIFFFAVSTFALVAVQSFSCKNQGNNIAQSSAKATARGREERRERERKIRKSRKKASSTTCQVWNQSQHHHQQYHQTSLLLGEYRLKRGKIFFFFGLVCSVCSLNNYSDNGNKTKGFIGTRMRQFSCSEQPTGISQNVQQTKRLTGGTSH